MGNSVVKPTLRGKDKVGANGITDYRHRGKTFRTSNALIDGITAKEPSLFPDEIKEIDTGQSFRFMDKEGRRAVLSSTDHKVIIALTAVIDTLLEKQEVKKFIDELPYNITQRAKSNLSTRVSESIDILNLTKAVYSKNRIGGKQIENVKKSLLNLAKYRLNYKIKIDRKEYRFSAPLIYLGKAGEMLEDGTYKTSKIRIDFEDVFFYEIGYYKDRGRKEGRYTLFPTSTLQLINKAGVRTSLFYVLFNILARVQGTHARAARIAVAEREKELKKEYKDKGEMEKELAALKKEKLTYRESFYSLLQKSGTDKYKVGKYIHEAKFRKDMEQATKDLLKMGIITEYKEKKGANKEPIACFVLDERWPKVDTTE